jgi:hypothetical protein
MLLEQVASGIGGALGLLYPVDKLRTAAGIPFDALLQVAAADTKLSDCPLGGMDHRLCCTLPCDVPGNQHLLFVCHPLNRTNLGGSVRLRAHEFGAPAPVSAQGVNSVVVIDERLGGVAEIGVQAADNGVLAR